MSHTTLYRKLRPKNFQDVIGQDHIIQTFKNQLIHDKLTHAYLFCGTRGTGKTSTARILAKAVNCENLQDGEPCNVCTACKNIISRSTLSVVEIDAASNNSVENIRDLNEEVKYPPTDVKYKVYIIDEVHMLSVSAFNALLKTLEEPPQYIIFMLVTTDPQKIPSTIHSRCQRFDFKRVSSNHILEMMRNYSNVENIRITDDALLYIAEISDGAMRDVLSVFDQCMSFYFNEEITLDKVQNIVGAVSKDVLFDATEFLYECNTTGIMQLIENVSQQGRDLSQYINDMIVHFRNLLIAKKADDTSFNLSRENIDKLKKQSAKIDASTLISFINIFSDLQSQLKFASNHRILLEVACIKICNPISQGDNAENIFARLTKLEKMISEQKYIIPAEEKSSNTDIAPKPKIRPKSVPSDIKEVCQKWKGFINSFQGQEFIPIRNYLNMSRACYLDGNHLTIVFESSTTLDIIEKKEKSSNFIKNKLEQIFNKQFSLIFVTEDEYNSKHTMTYGAPDTLDYQQAFAKSNIEIEFED